MLPRLGSTRPASTAFAMRTAARLTSRQVERYTGRITWNASVWRKDPDTGKRQRVMRPRSEWITRQDEAQRIISNELWQRAQRRFEPAKGDAKVQTGGTPPGKRKYVLSGLLRCGVCGAHYIMADDRAYACGSHLDGNSCGNAVRVRRDHAQEVLLAPITERLQSPEIVAEMAKELQTLYAEEMKARQTRAADAPKELQELTARIERLGSKLRDGDLGDLTADELELAIASAERKKQELE